MSKPEYSKINYTSPSDLIPYEQNVKTHPEEQITKLAKLIENYGFPESKAVLVDEDMVIIAGHGRRLGAIKAGLGVIPYQVVTGLSEGDKRAMRISDNAVGESEWDYENLRLEYQELSLENYDINLLALDDRAIERIENLEYYPEDFNFDRELEEEKINKEPEKSKENICPECGFKF